MGARSRRKGKDGELEFAKLLTELGLISKRGQQRSGLEEDDVLTIALDGVHWEVKRDEGGFRRSWQLQAERDAGEAVPVVARRRNHEEWYVTLPARRMIEFAEALIYAKSVGGLFDD